MLLHKTYSGNQRITTALQVIIPEVCVVKRSQSGSGGKVSAHYMKEIKLTPMNLKTVYRVSLLFLCCIMLFQAPPSVAAEQQDLTGFDQQVKEWAFNCRDEVVKEFNKLLSTNQLSLSQLFDTFYIPIPNTYPQKYHTQYDKLADQNIRIILDKYLDMDKRLLFVVAVDVNGYLPTHNSRYSKPLTNDSDYNMQNNRTKRIFDDRTGLAAAKNTKPFLLQKYSRDTGEEIFDLSVPLYVSGKHWGAIRIGYTHK